MRRALNQLKESAIGRLAWKGWKPKKSMQKMLDEIGDYKAAAGLSGPDASNANL